MPIPPKGDPRRPLHLAIRSTRVLAVVFLLLSLCAVPGMLRITTQGPGGMPVWLGIITLMVYIVPGVCYLVFSIYLKKRRFWAVVATLALAALQLLFVLFGGIGTVVMMSISGGFKGGYVFIPIGVCGLFTLALGQLIYHLIKSFEAIKHTPIEQQRGFEPVMMANVALPQTDTSL